MADKGDRKSPAAPAEIEPDAPASAGEIAASRRLRDALEDPSLPNEDAALARALATAYAPASLQGAELDEIVGAALAPEETRAAARLRASLEGAASDEAPDDVSTLARALAAAWSPKPLQDEEHRRIVERAVAELDGARGADVIVLRPRSPFVRVALGAASVVALAAAVTLLVREAGRGATVEAPFARTRSTEPLFTEPFKTGEASARIDAIAMARASDFRDNRFARWGVR